MSNRLDPEQARHFVWPDLGPTCLQRLSADNTSKQKVKVGNVFRKVNFKAIIMKHATCQHHDDRVCPRNYTFVYMLDMV